MDLKKTICIVILLFAGIISEYSATIKDTLLPVTAQSVNSTLIENNAPLKDEANSIINEDINLTTTETNQVLQEVGQVLGRTFPIPSLKKYINLLINGDDIEMSRDIIHDIVVPNYSKNSCVLTWWNVIASVSDPLAWLLTGSLTVLSAFAAIYEDEALMLNSIMVVIGAICTVMKGVTKYSAGQANKIQDRQIVTAIYKKYVNKKIGLDLELNDINPQNNPEEVV